LKGILKSRVIILLASDDAVANSTVTNFQKALNASWKSMPLVLHPTSFSCWPVAVRVARPESAKELHLQQAKSTTTGWHAPESSKGVWANRSCN
jgi:acetamidase/formamidase